MTALIVILSILLFILFLLVMPVTIYLNYGDELKISVRYLFVKIKLVPKKEKKKQEKKSSSSQKEKDKKKKPEKEKNNQFKDILKEQGLKGIIYLLKEIIKILKNTLNSMRKHITIKNFNLYIAVASEDAADTAVNYGYACAVVYPAFSFICSAVGKVKKHNLQISADYNSKETKTLCDLKASIKPIFIISTAFSALINAVKLTLKIKK